MGGVVAFEMARQLSVRGREVALLVLMDSAPPRPGRRTGDEADARRAFALYRQVAMLSTEPPTISYERFRQLSPEERVRRIVEEAQRANLAPAGAAAELIRRQLEVTRVNARALRSYQPQQYRGRIVLLVAERRRREPGDPTVGWSRLSSEPVEVHAIPGDHYTILQEPQVSVLAEQLKRCLEAARKETP
jgi:thioesterase domain-containing protein